MGEGSRKCIPALKYWAFYSREKFSHITGSQDYFLITQKHLWDNDPHMWLEFLEILHFYFTLFVVLILSIFFFLWYSPAVSGKMLLFESLQSCLGGMDMVRKWWDPFLSPDPPDQSFRSVNDISQHSIEFFSKAFSECYVVFFFPLKMPFLNKNVSMYCLKYI